MKIVTLNTWGGRAGKENLLAFFQKYKDTVDVFCLQEMWSAPYEHLEGANAGGVGITHENIMVYGKQEVSALCSEHASFFHPHHLENYGLMMLVNREVSEAGEFFVHKHKGFVPEGDVGRHARNIQFVKTTHNNKPLTVINFHGLWNGQGKTDSEDRLQQSRKIVEFLETLEGEVVFCGDFNLLPDTQSIKIIEDTELRNLIKEYGITSTRTSHYTKPEKFADYMFVSKGLEVKEFRVLPNEVSDHAPLYLEIV